MAAIVLARKLDWLYCIVIVLLKFQLLIFVLELYWSQKARIGQPWFSALMMDLKILRGQPSPNCMELMKSWLKYICFTFCEFQVPVKLTIKRDMLSFQFILYKR